MGFGINLAKGAATTAANALTGGLAGGLVDGIFGLFGGVIVTGKQIGRAHV